MQVAVSHSYPEAKSGIGRGAWHDPALRIRTPFITCIPVDHGVQPCLVRTVSYNIVPTMVPIVKEWHGSWLCNAKDGRCG